MTLVPLLSNVSLEPWTRTLYTTFTTFTGAASVSQFSISSTIWLICPQLQTHSTDWLYAATVVPAFKLLKLDITLLLQRRRQSCSTPRLSYRSLESLENTLNPTSIEGRLSDQMRIRIGISLLSQPAVLGRWLRHHADCVRRSAGKKVLKGSFIHWTVLCRNSFPKNDNSENSPLKKFHFWLPYSFKMGHLTM